MVRFVREGINRPHLPVRVPVQVDGWAPRIKRHVVAAWTFTQGLRLGRTSISGALRFVLWRPRGIINLHDIDPLGIGILTVTAPREIISIKIHKL